MSDIVLPAAVADACLSLLGEIENRIEDLGLASRKHTLKSALRHISHESGLDEESLGCAAKILRDGNELARSLADALSKHLAQLGTPECSVEPEGTILPEPSIAIVDERGAVQNPLMEKGDASNGVTEHIASAVKEQPTPNLQEVAEVPIESIMLSSDFESLFGPDSETYQLLVESLKGRGFDQAEPLVVWAGCNILIDGNQRFKASKEAGLKSVFVHFKHFDDEQQALIYAVRRQLLRRKLTDGQLLRLVQKIDKPQGHGGDRRSAATKIKTSNEVMIRSSNITAEHCGISKTMVERIRALLKRGLGDLVEAVENDELSIHAAYEQLQERRGRRKKNPSQDQWPKTQPEKQEPSGRPESANLRLEATPSVGSIGVATRHASVSDQAQRAPQATVVELERWISTIVRLIDEMEKLSFPLASRMTEIQRELDGWKNRLSAEAAL